MPARSAPRMASGFSLPEATATTEPMRRRSSIERPMSRLSCGAGMTVPAAST